MNIVTLEMSLEKKNVLFRSLPKVDYYIKKRLNRLSIFVVQ